jgi:hypothetical protein
VRTRHFSLMKDCSALMSCATATLVWCNIVEIHPALVTKLRDDAPSRGARLAMHDLDCQRPPRSNAERCAIHLLKCARPSIGGGGLSLGRSWTRGRSQILLNGPERKASGSSSRGTALNRTKICAVAGVGPGLGFAVRRRFVAFFQRKPVDNKRSLYDKNLFD